eukprot:XP_001705436.1 Hypothetical protein GL50803_32262 [Giardia lamblia ATCC 50803]
MPGQPDPHNRQEYQQGSGPHVRIACPLGGEVRDVPEAGGEGEEGREGRRQKGDAGDRKGEEPEKNLPADGPLQ